jgi:hypothetical protein
MRAVFKYNPYMVVKIIDAGADVNTQDNDVSDNG